MSPCLKTFLLNKCTSPTFVLVAVDTEADGATQQEQEEKAAGDSSCNAGNGRATQPFT